MEPRQAIHDAAVVRLRPIMMTTAAAVLGAVPLAIGIGQGASLRQPLGITVMGGLILSQVFTLYTTPVIYLYLDRLRVRLARWSATLPWNRQMRRERIDMNTFRKALALLARAAARRLPGRPQLSPPAGADAQPSTRNCAGWTVAAPAADAAQGRLVDRVQRSVAR